jgi:DNA-binding response OmpR family regulator
MMRVLIAEDNPLWKASLERQVKGWGYEAVVVDNGKDALEILGRDDAPRLAILDWQMPEMDGIDVCKLIKRDPKYSFTYVVMLTSRDADADMVAGLDAGADDYLIKPVESAILRSRLMAGKRIVELVPPKEWAIPRIPNYEFRQVIGKGAFATVWEALHEPDQQTVALKIIRVDLATEDIFNRFGREIQLTTKLTKHPNIAQVLDSHIDKQLAYYAMELVDGMTLSSFVKKHQPDPMAILRFIADVWSMRTATESFIVI